MDTLTSIVYALAALAGLATYVWWKWPNDEEFNPKKAFESLIRGGAFSVLLSSFMFAANGLDLTNLVFAYGSGLTLDAGFKSIMDSTPTSIKNIFAKQE